MVQLYNVSQLLLQKQSAKVSVNGTFWTVFSMKTNVSGLQSLSGVQQWKKGLAEIAFPRAPHIVFPQPSIITRMHVFWSWPGNPGTSRSQWSSSQLALVGMACAVLPAQCGLQDVPSATGQLSSAHSDRGACCYLPQYQQLYTCVALPLPKSAARSSHENILSDWCLKWCMEFSRKKII